MSPSLDTGSKRTNLMDGSESSRKNKGYSHCTVIIDYGLFVFMQLNAKLICQLVSGSNTAGRIQLTA